jgi:hypothetical protein
VGGFGDSPYLLDALKTWSKENGDIRIFCPPHPYDLSEAFSIQWSSSDNTHRQATIVKGAALRGLEGIKPTKKRCRRHYGFRIAEKFREGIDPEEDAFRDEFDGTKYCSGMTRWQITKASL